MTKTARKVLADLNSFETEFEQQPETGTPDRSFRQVEGPAELFGLDGLIQYAIEVNHLSDDSGVLDRDVLSQRQLVSLASLHTFAVVALLLAIVHFVSWSLRFWLCGIRSALLTC